MTKKIFKLFCLIALLVLSQTAHARLNVVTTTADLAAIAREVGGTLVIVKSICRGDQDPHYLEAKPSYAVLLNKADLLIEAGLDLEIGWLPVLLTQARNPKIQRGQPGHLDASKGVLLLEIPTGRIDRSLGDVHPLGNPHYWLNPENGFIIAGHVAQKLSELDPAHAGEYEQNLNVFTQRLTLKIASWKQNTSVLKHKKIITHHRTYSYLADWVGLNVVDVIEPKPGIPPSPFHILSLIEKIKSQHIELIVAENYLDPKPAQELGQKTGARVLFLPSSVGGLPGLSTYESLFDHIFQQMGDGS